MFAEVWADVYLFTATQKAFSLVSVTEKKERQILIVRTTIGRKMHFPHLDSNTITSSVR